MTSTENTHTPVVYNTLEEIRLRKERLSDDIDREGDKIAQIWSDVFHRHDESSKGEYVASVVTHAITAIDAFLLVRKLMKNYSGLLSFLTSGKKKRK